MLPVLPSIRTNTFSSDKVGVDEQFIPTALWVQSSAADFFCPEHCRTKSAACAACVDVTARIVVAASIKFENDFIIGNI